MNSSYKYSSLSFTFKTTVQVTGCTLHSQFNAMRISTLISTIICLFGYFINFLQSANPYVVKLSILDDELALTVKYNYFHRRSCSLT